MSDVITLTCPSCGGRLQITPDINRFVCAHCGNEHVVRRSGGIVSVQPIVEGLHSIQKGTDKTASELAIRRIQEELSSLAWTRQKINEQIAVLQANVQASHKKRILTVLTGIFALAATVFSCLFLLLLPMYQRDSANIIVALAFVAFLVAGLISSGLFLWTLTSLLSLSAVPSTEYLKQAQLQKQDERQSITMQMEMLQKELQNHQKIVSLPD